MRLLLVLLVAVPLSAQTTAPVKYEVSIPSPAAHLFHLSAEFPSGGKDTLFVSLPAWSPGNYEIQNYARYVRHFGAKNAQGQALFWDRFDKDTWRVVTGKSDRVTAEFDYLADTIDLSLARIPPKGLGYIVGKKAGAPVGSTVVFAVEGSPEIMAAISVTEPNIGSDVASVSCRAERTEGGWHITGAKAWCTFAGRADVIALLARTDPAEPGAYEAALLADGVAPDKLYPLDTARAEGVLNAARPALVFWKTGAESQQLLESGGGPAAFRRVR